MQKTVEARGRRASWFVAPIIVAGLLALMWPTAQASDGPTVASPDSAPHQVYVPLALYDPPVPPSVFAVEMKEVSFAGRLAQAVQAGAYWIRFGAFNWDEIQPLQTDPPQYNWAAVDELSLKNIAATGTQAIAIVRFAPPWA